MGTRSKVLTLPKELKAQLDERLIASGFSGYEELVKWLADKGQDISKSSLHRYGKNFENRVYAIKEATEQSQALMDYVGDDSGALNESLIKLYQEQVFRMLINGQTDIKELKRLGSIIADIARASVQQGKYRREFGSEKKALLEEAVKAGKMDSDAAKQALQIMGLNDGQ